MQYLRRIYIRCPTRLKYLQTHKDIQDKSNVYAFLEEERLCVMLYLTHILTDVPKHARQTESCNIKRNIRSASKYWRFDAPPDRVNCQEIGNDGALHEEDAYFSFDLHNDGPFNLVGHYSVCILSEVLAGL